MKKKKIQNVSLYVQRLQFMLIINESKPKILQSKNNKKHMAEQQSIYNIIPKEFKPQPKGKLYKSKYPPNIPPTGSTFGTSTTSKPGVSNLGGQYQLGLQTHTQFGRAKTFDHSKGFHRASTRDYLKKRTGSMGDQSLPEPRKFSYNCIHKKQPVPKPNQIPVHGIKTNKNFIVSNAIQNILSTAKKIPEPVDYLKKSDYGEVPQYLQKIKQHINDEYKMMQNLHKANNEEKKCLTEQQVNELREGLKRKWEEINHEYQKMTHIQVVDTVGMKRRKEGYEKQLSEIERDIKHLNKTYIFVEQ